ncbi:MAG: permease [archaeon]
MAYMLPVMFNAIVLVFFLAFYYRDKDKSIHALRLSIRSFESIAPIFVVVILLLVFLQGFISEDVISLYVGGISGPWGYLLAAIAGAVVHVPPFITFPLAGQFLHAGVNPGYIAVLVTSLVMVHTFSMPIEIKELGLKFALVRNFLCFVFAIFIGVIMGVLY